MNLEELKQRLSGLLTVAEDHVKSGKMDEYDKLLPQIEDYQKQIKATETIAEAKAATVVAEKKPKPKIVLPLGTDDPPDDEETKAAELKELKAAEDKAFNKTLRHLRYGDVDESKDMIARQILGDNYMQVVEDQDRAFKSYLRFGDSGCATRGISLKPLGSQVWHIEDVVDMLKSGMLVKEIKATMVEGTDILGGYAVPPQRAREILRRTRGLTAVRDGGATVVDTASNQIEWLVIRGRNLGGSLSDQYPSGLRGAWGHETQSPSEQSFEFELEKIPVEVYTFKVPASVSVLEDAANFVDILMTEIAEVIAVDEDVAFISGDGANKPRGIMPGNAPETGIATLVSGIADDIEVSTTKKLRRSIASQYRANGRAVWVWNSDTGADIEVWQDGIGRFYLETVEAGERFFRFGVRETEAMPDVAGAAYPILFGDMRGYAIVQRLGLSVARFIDSNTGVNKAEFHVRRRIGGRVIQPYRFAVLNCST